MTSPHALSGMFYEMPPNWGAADVERIQSSLSDTNLSTQQTVAAICRHAREALRDSRIRAIASRTNGQWAGGPPERRICWDVFWFCKRTVRFKLDEHSVLQILNEQDQVDFLIPPPVLIRMRRPAGDCDDFTMLACALLTANNVPWEIVTIACDPHEPGRWSHVYLRAVLPDGQRVPLDPTNGQWPGWEVPARDVFRKQIWDMDGNPIEDSAPVKRMHGYVRRRRRGFRGLGDETSDTVVSYDPTGTFGAGGGDIQEGGTYIPPPPAQMTPIPSGSAGGGTNWSSIVSSLANLGGRLGTIALTPRGGYVTTDARGNLIVSNTGLPVATAGSGNLIFYGILAVAGIGILMAIGGGRR